MGLLVKSEKIQTGTSIKTTNTNNTNNTTTTKMKMTKGVSFDQGGVQSAKSTDSAYASADKGPLSIKQRIRSARKRGMRGDVYDLQYLVEEGPLSFRSFGFLGGFFMILASCLDFMETEEEPVSRLVTYNLWVAGLIIIQVEGRPFHLQIPIVYDFICLFFTFLQYVWGRGFLYFVAGVFQFFIFSKYNMISGVYFMILGAFSIVFGYRASVRLAGLRSSIQNKDEIKFMFHSFDKDRDGYLNSEEFRELLMAMGQNLDHNDFVAAMGAVDIENKQMVSYEDLENWWQGYNDNDLPPGAGLCVGCGPRQHSHNNNAHLMA
jgi:hypothetical protein